MLVLNLNSTHAAWKEQLSNDYLDGTDNLPKILGKAHKQASGGKDNPNILVNKLKEAGSTALRRKKNSKQHQLLKD